MRRRKFLIESGRLSLGASFLAWSACNGSSASTEDNSENQSSATSSPSTSTDLWFDISLAQWSLHRTIRSGQLDNLDFAQTAREIYGISAVEYVNQFFEDKGNDTAYLNQMKQRAEDHGVESLLIMIDNEGNLGEIDDEARTIAVENHFKWVEAAKLLGCHSIRVNARGEGSREDVGAAASDGLARLSTFAAQENINVIVENHGGYSSDASWLATVVRNTEMSNCGTLPDFGNFCIKQGEDGCAEEYDRYQGMQELMPLAKAVSAKTNDFDAEGNETNTDYERVLGIVKEAGYRGFIGIEYGGHGLEEEAGIKATKELLIRAGLAI
ncbi:MAG: TIM barrel protein [Bacteroidota bacterium]